MDFCLELSLPYLQAEVPLEQGEMDYEDEEGVIAKCLSHTVLLPVSYHTIQQNSGMYLLTCLHES